MICVFKKPKKVIFNGEKHFYEQLLIKSLLLYED